MPKLPKHVDKICFHCRSYLLTENGPRCDYWQKTFPDYNAWVTDPRRIKPGERTCRHWTDKD